jgi:hypothetical protein
MLTAIQQSAEHVKPGRGVVHEAIASVAAHLATAFILFRFAIAQRRPNQSMLRLLNGTRRLGVLTRTGRYSRPLFIYHGTGNNGSIHPHLINGFRRLSVIRSSSIHTHYESKETLFRR